MSDNVQMQGLEFQIKTVASDGSKSVKSLKENLDKLKSSLGKLNTSKLESMSKNLSDLGKASESASKIFAALDVIGQSKISVAVPNSITRLSTAIKSITDEDITRMKSLASSMVALSGVGSIKIPKVGESTATSNSTTSTNYGISEEVKSLEDLRMKLSELTNPMAKVGSGLLGLVIPFAKATTGAAKLGMEIGSKLASSMKTFTSNLRRHVPTVSSFTGKLGTLFSSLKRIAFYRAIRFFFSTLTNSIKEGVNNLYQYSAVMGGTFKGAMDSLATSFQYLKNSMGAMVSPIIEMIAPAVDYLVDKFVSLLNIINQVFAKLNGASSYTRAVKVSKQYADATSDAADGTSKASEAAKELKKTVLGFDELNIMNGQDDSSSSGGSGSGSSGASTPDYGSMFETVPIDSKISDFMDRIKKAFNNGDWKTLGKELGNKFNEIFDSIPWAKIGTKVGKGIDGVAKTLYYTLDTIDFKNIGTKWGEMINNALTEIDFEFVGRDIVKPFTSFLETAIAFFGELDWGLVASSFSSLLIGALDEVTEFVTQYDWQAMGSGLWNKIKDLFEGFDFAGVASRFFYLLGYALTGAVQFVWGYISEAWGDIFDYFKQCIEDADTGSLGGDIIMGILNGIGNVITGIYTWIWNNVVKPLIQGFKDALGIHSPAKKMIPIGEQIVAGLLQGIKDTFGTIVTFFHDKISAIVESITTAWETVKTTTSDIWNSVKEYLRGVFDNIHDKVKTVWDFVNEHIIEKVTGAYDTVTEKFEGIWDTVKTVGEDIMNTMGEVADFVAGVFDFDISFPDIPLPHISVSGWEDIAGIFSIPTGFEVDWYARGGIMNGATLFGMNGNSLMMGGEAGKEAILPLESHTEWMDTLAAKVRDGLGGEGDMTYMMYAEMSRQNTLLKRQNELLEDIREKDMTAEITTSSIVSALQRNNRRNGTNTIQIN